MRFANENNNEITGEFRSKAWPFTKSFVCEKETRCYGAWLVPQGEKPSTIHVFSHNVKDIYYIINLVTIRGSHTSYTITDSNGVVKMYTRCRWYTIMTLFNVVAILKNARKEKKNRDNYSFNFNELVYFSLYRLLWSFKWSSPFTGR